MSDTKIGLVVNRFSYITEDHVKLIKKAADENNFVIIVIGSSDRARDINCPFTYEERKVVIEDIMASEEFHSYSYCIVPIEDSPYNSIAWTTKAHSIVYKAIEYINVNPNTINVYAFDNTAFEYEKLFPAPSFNVIKVKKNINNERDVFFIESIINWATVFDEIAIRHYVNHVGTEQYNKLVDEYNAVKSMKDSWASSPFPPTFVTTDAVVYYRGHVLVVTRNGPIGNGLYCLPGGFLSQNHTVNDGIIENLKKDTGIKVYKPILQSNVVDTHVFDDPNRSTRGRIITTAGLIVLDNVSSLNELPKVRNIKGDKTHAQWLSLYDIEHNPEKFFEDHFYIIKYMLSLVDNK